MVQSGVKMPSTLDSESPTVSCVFGAQPKRRRNTFRRSSWFKKCLLAQKACRFKSCSRHHVQIQSQVCHLAMIRTCRGYSGLISSRFPISLQTWVQILLIICPRRHSVV